MLLAIKVNMSLSWYATWTVEEYVKEFLPSLSHNQARNIVCLFNQNCSLPFIARYKTDRIGNVTVEKLRQAYELFKEAKSVNEKIGSLLKNLSKDGKDDEALTEIVRQSKSVEEISDIRADIVGTRQGTLTKRAVTAGLQTVATTCLEVGQMFDGDFLTSEEFPTAESVRDAVGALIRQTLLAKPSIKDLLDRIEYCWVLYDVSLYYRRRDANRVFVTVNANASTRRLAKQKKAQSSSVSTAEGTSAEREYLNFSHYFNFRSSIASLRPHQVMAINRGVKRKVLKKQFTVPQSWLSEFLAATAKLMGKSGCNEAKAFVANCTKTCYTKVVRPRLVSRLWNKASKLARIHAVECFATNLESLLLTAPVKGHSIIGVDPGFTNGCKYAMISAQGDILATGIFYLPQVNNSRFHVAISEFCDFAVCHRCDRIAIGNGKGSKETVAYLKCLIREKRFKDLDIRWRVVNETGSSVYSISSSAELEMPELSPNLRSAVSIARRVLDPLSEYIKIGPASLSVGMYQHDIPSSVLKTTVDMVVEQCVSFVGVDVNTCSVDLLEHVTGLNKKTAKAICEFRQKNGPFVCRYQLKCVKGVSEHAFQMCSGFVRIHGKHDDSSAAWRPNPLDATSIHPESYPIVER
ncbi:Tex-like protein [Trichuris suis]|nr:Tex-like protein [Trichuris suis]